MNVGWLIGNWRLKILALGLTLSLLGAVSFSQNPIEFRPVPVNVEFANPHGLVVMNPPKKQTLTVVGLKDAIDRLQASSVGLTVDLTDARPGPNQTFTGRTKVTVPGVTVQQDSTQFVLSLDTYERQPMDITVRTPQLAPGLTKSAQAICNNSQCQEAVSGPSSLVTTLKAVVDYDSPITTPGQLFSGNQRVFFEANGKKLDLNQVSTFPPILIDQPTVDVKIDVQGGTLTRAVGLTVKATGTQACGYTLNSLDIQPNAFVNVSGPSDAVARLSSISLEDVSIAGATATAVFQRPVRTQNGVSAEPSSVRVVANLTQAFSCAAPSPTPTPSPSRTP